MKKVIFSALTFFMLSTVVAFAQDAPATQEPATTEEQPSSTMDQDQGLDQDQPAADVSEEMRTEVSLEELPEAISSQLAGEEYTEWTPTTSYRVIDENENEHYAVELQKEDELKTVTFDAEGNKVEDEDASDIENEINNDLENENNESGLENDIETESTESDVENDIETESTESDVENDIQTESPESGVENDMENENSETETETNEVGTGIE